MPEDDTGAQLEAVVAMNRHAGDQRRPDHATVPAMRQC
jgi:hypothetical protein